MKELINNLISISETLSVLTVKLETMAEAFEKDALQAKPAKKTAVKKKTAPKVAKKKATPKKKIAAKKKAAPKEAKPAAKASEQTRESGSMLDIVYGLISSGGEGTTVSEIKERTGLTPRQVNNSLYKLKQKGKIESISKGAYVKKES